MNKPNSKNPKPRPDSDTDNIESVKYSFSLKQILVIASFVGTTAITIGYAAFSYYKTVDSVKEIKNENDKIHVQIDTLYQRTSDLKQQLIYLNDKLPNKKIK